MTRLATPIFGLDSTSAVPIAAHHAVGSHFAIRYVSRWTSKTMSKDEYLHDAANGIGMVAVFEDGADNPLGGYEKGKSDGEYALRFCLDRGMPPGRPCSFAYDADPSGIGTRTDAYYDGVAAVWTHELCGPYGGYELVERCFNRRFGYAFSSYAWSGGRIHPRAQVHQYSNDHVIGGVGVDFDHAYYADYGQWNYKPAPPADHFHYHIFDPTPRDIVHGKSERLVVQRYDQLRVHGVANRAKLAPVRHDLTLLYKRLYRVSTATHPDTFGFDNRGRRIQEMMHRSQGISYPLHHKA